MKVGQVKAQQVGPASGDTWTVRIIPSTDSATRICVDGDGG